MFNYVALQSVWYFKQSIFQNYMYLCSLAILNMDLSVLSLLAYDRDHNAVSR